MSDAHSDSFIKTPTQLIVVIVLAFVIPLAIIYLIIQMVMGTGKPNDPAMSDKQVAERIQPVGGVPASAIEKGPSPLVAAPAAPAAAAAVTPAPGAQAAAAPVGDSGKGKSVYDASCAACHGAGVAGAPKVGDTAAWAPRLKAGADAMVVSAIKGKNAMPPKGGNPALADADVKAAVEFMVSQSR